MPDSGAIRSDVTIEKNVRPGEDRRFSWLVRDENRVPLTDLTGRTYALYVLKNADAPLGEAILNKTSFDTTTPPFVRLSTNPADWTGIGTGDYSYELWRTDSGNVRCVAYGDFIVHRGARQKRLPVR